MRSVSLFAIGLLTSCGSDNVRFGHVTDDAKQAMHDWCKQRLEMESHMETVDGKHPLFESPSLLIMHCWNSGSGEQGWLAFDSVSGDLINVTLDLSSSDFDRIVSRTVLPSLDAEQKTAYDGLRAALGSATGTVTKSWKKGSAYMDVTAIEVTVPNTDPIWQLMLGYKMEPRK